MLAVGFQQFFDFRPQAGVILRKQSKDNRKGEPRSYDPGVRLFIFLFHPSCLLSAGYYTAFHLVCLSAVLVNQDKKLSNFAGFIMPPL